MTDNEFKISKIEPGDMIIFNEGEYVILEVDYKRKAIRISGEFEWISYMDFDVKHD